MPTISSHKDAETFLKRVGLKVEEAVVRKTVLVLRGLVDLSLYDLYARGTRPDGSERTPTCARETAKKISRIYQSGALDPYIRYLEYLDSQEESSTPEHDQQVDDNLHQDGLRELLSQWLGYAEEVPLESWLKIVTDYFLSPSGLLTWAQNTLRALSRDETVEPSSCSNQDDIESMLEEFAPQRALPAAPELLQSPLFPSLQQHLAGDVLWEHWTSANETRANLSAHIWTRALYLFSFTLLRLSEVPADSQQVASKKQSIAKIQLMIEESAYRDQVSPCLKTAIYLLGADLIKKGVQESKHSPDVNSANYVLNQMMQEAEDQLQRLPVPPQWVRPKAGVILEMGRQIWDGSLGQESSQNLGQEAVCELIQFWQGRSQASEELRLRLKTLITTRPFPGNCSVCREL